MKIRLSKKADQVYASVEGKSDVAVSIVWARPSSGPGKEVSILSNGKEVAYLENLDVLDDQSRETAERELSQRYFIPIIKKVIETDIHLGNRYLDVLTDCGAVSFIMKNPYMNIRSVQKDGMLISDVLGNLYLIPSFSNLDKISKREMEKVI